MRTNWRGLNQVTVLALLLAAGCSQSHYRKSADNQVYGLIGEKETDSLGRTNAFSIDTRYSARKPNDIPGTEIISDRLQSGRRKINVAEALKIAVEYNRTYQSRKEQLYLAALRLTSEIHRFQPSLFGNAVGNVERFSDGTYNRRLTSRFGVDQALKTGANIGVSVANDVVAYYSGKGSYNSFSILSATISQPLLRGAGAAVAAENLTQADRDLVYEVRGFSQYQNSFAVDIVTSYFRLLGLRDTVRNEYNNYQNLIASRERAEALAFDRQPAFQADQARQDELRAKSRYVLAVDNYQRSVDSFKLQLALPLGVEINLDDSALEDLKKTGLVSVALDETEGYELAVKNRLDLINEIDRFEDSKRKITVAADGLKTTLNIFASASLNSNDPDYARFDFNKWRGGVGLQLNLPLDRLNERNIFRTSFINFERQLRTFSIFLDDTRNQIRQDLRTLQQSRQNYDIQTISVELAERRVDSARLLLAAGRAQIRDLLEAQSALLQARNAVVALLVDYNVARLALLLDLGLLKTDIDQFWVKEFSVPTRMVAQPSAGIRDEVIPPDKLFGN